ncbi:hypothetical protein VPH35_044469 [Triticum aestivum]
MRAPVVGPGRPRRRVLKVHKRPRLHSKAICTGMEVACRPSMMVKTTSGSRASKTAATINRFFLSPSPSFSLLPPSPIKIWCAKAQFPSRASSANPQKYERINLSKW